jgi:oligopeptide/dipeptide ABC transporter ATP-binding protein
MTILETRGLKVHFPVTGGVFGTVKGHIHAVNGVSLLVSKGEIVSVVGESGCGKSTLGLAMLGLVPITDGMVLLNGTEIDRRHPGAWKPFRKKFQIIFQDPFTSLNPRHTIFRILSEPLVLHGICARGAVKDQVNHLLQQVGLPPDYCSRFPHAFSGGQRQRIAIARAIGVQPSLIVCDEVVSALDVSVQAQIIHLLLRLKEEMNLSLLFIAHDLSLVKAISDRVYVMYMGHIVEASPAHELFTRPRHPYTQALLNSIPTLDRKIKPSTLAGEVPSPIDIPIGCVFRTRCPFARERCQSRQPEMTTDGNRTVACFFPLE